MFPTVVAAFILTPMFVRLALQHASTTSFIVTALTCPFLAVESFVDVLPLTLVTYNTTTMQREEVYNFTNAI